MVHEMVQVIQRHWLCSKDTFNHGYFILLTILNIVKTEGFLYRHLQVALKNNNNMLYEKPLPKLYGLLDGLESFRYRKIWSSEYSWQKIVGHFDVSLWHFRFWPVLVHGAKHLLWFWVHFYSSCFNNIKFHSNKWMCNSGYFNLNLKGIVPLESAYYFSATV